MTEIQNQVPDIVLQDIELYKKQTGREFDLSFFNNFGTKLPGGSDYEFSDALLDRKPSPNRNLYSEKRRGLTHREFIGECADVCSELGLDEQAIYKAEYDHDLQQTKESAMNLVNFYLPIYVKLRERGYNRVDLTS